MRQQYIRDNEEALREQAQSFYRGIIRAVDSDARVEFDYISARR